jgi:pyridoxamine 5'-phosphate oxidase family protein
MNGFVFPQVPFLDNGVQVVIFSEGERQYLEGQRLARLATADGRGAPHVVPVGFRPSEDGRAIDIGGHDLANSKKWRDLKANPRVAVVVDDLERIDPWTPRGIEVRGVAELHDAGGAEKFGPEIRGEAWIRILPKRVTSWGIEAHAFSPSGRRRSRTVGA